MKVKDLLGMDIDIDVYDNVCEELSIAFVGPVKLSEEGEQKFSRAMDLPVCLDTGMGLCEIDVANEDEKTERRNLQAAKRLFYAAAGYCSEEDYCRWFAPLD